MLRLGHFFFQYRNALFPVFLVGSALLLMPIYAVAEPRAESALDWAGIAFALAGQALRALTIGFEYIIRGGKNRQIYATNLVQGGVFAHSRNPLYLGNVLIFTGLALISGSIGTLALGLLVVVFVYRCMIIAEEDYLQRKFGGEYDEYCRRVNRVWPNWRGFRKSIAGMRFNWKRLIGKELNTTFGWILGAMLLEALAHYWLHGGRYLFGAYLGPAAFAFVLTAFVYASVYFLKKWGAFQ